MSFNVGVTALTTNQAALQVVGHNIANVNTPGYSRQRVSLEQVPGQMFGNGYFGKGVQVAAVERSFNQFLTREANLSAASAAAANTRYQRLQTLEQLFPMGEAGMGRQLNGFLNAWADVVASPTNQTARGVVLTRAAEFANRLNQTARQLEELRVTTRVQIEAGIDQANRLTASIASLNQRIVDAFATGRTPNDLLDQRDQLVAELNKIVQVNTLEADDRSLTVFVGSSVPVVLGNRSTPLVGSESINAAGRYTIGFGSAEAVINEGLLAGGQLKGALTFYNDDVADVRNQLGRMALSTIELFNRQHAAGLDLNGEPGRDFFNPVSFGTAVTRLTPTSTAALSVSVDPAADAPTRFKASDYAVQYVGADQVVIRRVSDGAYFDPGTGEFSATSPVTATFPAAPNNFLTFDGLRLTQSATGVAGDQFVLRPFASVAAQVSVALTSPSQLAVASPVLIEAGTGNADTLEVEALYRVPVALGGPLPQSDIAISFNAAGQFTVAATSPAAAVTVQSPAGNTLTPPGGPYAFTSGQEIILEVAGQAPLRLVLRGAPTDGDTFTIRSAAGTDMRQNAGNGQALLALRDLDALDGYTLSDGYIPVFAAVSSSIQVAKADSEFATRVADQAESARANQAGVNLDEEAARLLQFQQAYQAAAKYLQSIQSIFDTLLSTFR
jgi:flagellar hook-associated protein 1 FlgK